MTLESCPGTSLRWGNAEVLRPYYWFCTLAHPSICFPNVDNGPSDP